MRFFPVFVLLLLLLLHESRGWDKCRKKLDKCVTKIWRSGGYKGKFEHPSPNHQSAGCALVDQLMECFRYSKCSIDKRGHVKALKVALGNLENGINFQRHGSEVKLDETCPNYPL